MIQNYYLPFLYTEKVYLMTRLLTAPFRHSA